MTDTAREEKEIRYSLFAAHTDKDAIDAAVNVDYCRITDKYCLFYVTDEEMTMLPKKVTQLSEEETEKLPFEDEEWLRECNERIIRYFLEQHQEEERRYFTAFQEEFDAALAEEAAKIDKEAD